MSETQTIQCAAVLFDMDGVLVSSIGSVNRCWRRWAEHYDVESPEQVQIAHGTRAVDIMEQLKPGVDRVAGLRLIEDMEIDDVADLEVLPGVRVLLGSLPPERWAIVSSATYRLLVGRLHAAELTIPERIISGDRVERGKPDPEPYRRGAELLGNAADICLVVEDAPSGVQSGVAAGCRVLAVLGTHSADELRAAGASWVVATLQDVTVESVGDTLRLLVETVQMGVHGRRSEHSDH